MMAVALIRSLAKLSVLSGWRLYKGGKLQGTGKINIYTFARFHNRDPATTLRMKGIV